MKVEWRDAKWLQTRLSPWIPCMKDQSQISTTQDSTNKNQFFYGSNFSRSLFRVSSFN